MVVDALAPGKTPRLVPSDVLQAGCELKPRLENAAQHTLRRSSLSTWNQESSARRKGNGTHAYIAARERSLLRQVQPGKRKRDVHQAERIALAEQREATEAHRAAKRLTL